MIKYDSNGVSYNPNEIWMDMENSISDIKEHAEKKLSSETDLQTLKKLMEVYNDIYYELTGGWLSEANVTKEVYTLTLDMARFMILSLDNKIKDLEGSVYADGSYTLPLTTIKEIIKINSLDKRLKSLGIDTYTNDDVAYAYNILTLKDTSLLNIPKSNEEKHKINLIARMIDKDLNGNYLWQQDQDDDFNKSFTTNIPLASALKTALQKWPDFCDINEYYWQLEINRIKNACALYDVYLSKNKYRHVEQLNNLTNTQFSLFCFLEAIEEKDRISFMLNLLSNVLERKYQTNFKLEEYLVSSGSCTTPVVYATLKPLSDDFLGPLLFNDNNSNKIFTMIYQKPISTIMYITNKIKIPFSIEVCGAKKRLCMKTCYPAQQEPEFLAKPLISPDNASTLLQFFVENQIQNSKLRDLLIHITFDNPPITLNTLAEYCISNTILYLYKEIDNARTILNDAVKKCDELKVPLEQLKDASRLTFKKLKKLYYDSIYVRAPGEIDGLLIHFIYLVRDRFYKDVFSIKKFDNLLLSLTKISKEFGQTHTEDINLIQKAILTYDKFYKEVFKKIKLISQFDKKYAFSKGCPLF